MINNKSNNLVLHVVLFIIAAISIGSASILVKLSFASAIACAFWRLFLTSMLTLVMYLITNSSVISIRKTLGKDRILMMFVSGVSLAFHFILWMESLFLIPIAISVTIVVAYPLHLALIEIVWEKERKAFTSLAGLLLGFLGIIVLFREAYIYAKFNVFGIMQSFTASILAAIYFYIGRYLRKTIDLYSYSFYVYTIASIIVLTYSLIIKENVFVYLPKSWLWFLLLAIVPMLGGHTIMNYLLKFYRSSSVTSIALAEPVIASILAVLVFGEVVEVFHIVCLAIILIGIAISLTPEFLSS
ncbi:MAG: DMT family transporter [Ignisphaera sp.]